MAPLASDYEQVRASGLIDDLVERGWLISSDTADLAALDSLDAALGDGVHAVIEHPRRRSGMSRLSSALGIPAIRPRNQALCGTPQ